jgi:hypothetical protein
MRKISISDEVYGAIATRGKFGETEDDVLRRVFEIAEDSAEPVPSSRRTFRRRVLSERTMSVRIEPSDGSNVLWIGFEGGQDHKWVLPPQANVSLFKQTLDKALEFAEGEGATEGQLKDIRKRLNGAGYYIHGPRV